VDKIRLLFDHPELMAGMSKNAKEYAREHLDISRMRDEYLDTFTKVLRN
jgi:glycosyltransferase involved in cell wall biosynthesis